MQIEEIIKLRLSCLDLPTKTAVQESVSSLELAKSFFDLVNKEKLFLPSGDSFKERKVQKQQ